MSLKETLDYIDNYYVGTEGIGGGFLSFKLKGNKV